MSNASATQGEQGAAPRALVTGAASGIGRAVAERFATGGWRVCGLDRHPAPPELRVDQWILCDLADEKHLHSTLGGLLDQRWTALINCAGVAGVGDPERILRINFLAVRTITEALAPRIETGGAILHISSGAGMKWMAHRESLRPILSADDADALRLAVQLAASPADAYRISKELLCLYGPTRCLREMHRGVRTNVISPGGVDTPLIADFTASMGADAMAFSLSVTQRHAAAREVASVAFFLASADASWVNGADIRVDGGLTAALNSGIADFPAWR